MTLFHLIVGLFFFNRTARGWLPPSSTTSASALHAVRRGLPDVDSLQGKTVHYRSIHRLTEDSDVSNPRALEIEEHFRAQLSPDTRDLEPFGNRLLIVRDGNAELLRFRVHESKRHVCRGADEYAPILYLAAEDPSLVLRNKVMELSCRLGLMGLLSTLVLGNLCQKAQQDKDNQDDKCDILPTEEGDSSFTTNSSLPPKMSSLTLTTSTDEEPVLDLVSLNLKEANADTTFGTRKFDWRLHPRFNPVKPYYGGILSNDIDFEYPSAKELARTVAYFLEPDGRFLHVCPADTNELNFLKKFLNEGYLMNLDERYFSVESRESCPQVVDGEMIQDEWKLDRTTVREYVALLAGHHADYDGTNGEYLFPMENGKFDGKKIDTPPLLYW